MKLPREFGTDTGIAYVTQRFPPLPEVYGYWLTVLAAMARAGGEPSLVIDVPGPVASTGVLPPGARRAKDGDTYVITLGEALFALDQEHLLEPDPEATWGDGVTVEVISPPTALVLASTIRPDAYRALHDPEAVDRLARNLFHGEWTLTMENPVTVDACGRLTSGLNEMLAIVKADYPAPMAMRYDYERAPRPLTWEPPGGNATASPPSQDDITYGTCPQCDRETYLLPPGPDAPLSDTPRCRLCWRAADAARIQEGNA